MNTKTNSLSWSKKYTRNFHCQYSLDMKGAAIVSLICLSIIVEGRNPDWDKRWENFISQYNKTYDGSDYAEVIKSLSSQRIVDRANFLFSNNLQITSYNL